MPKKQTLKNYSITKKIRFEVFKRDGFRCAYCGKTPPEATLEVDHIQPKAKGGKNDINNYITACFDCNRGKRDTLLAKIPNKLSENLEILQEKEAQLKEYQKAIRKIERRINKDILDISKVYSDAYPGWEFSDNFKQISLKAFLKSLAKTEIIDSLRTAICKLPKDRDNVIRYFCGICWNKIREGQDE